MYKDRLNKPEDIFNRNKIKSDPTVRKFFFKVMEQLNNKQKIPPMAHYFRRLLQDKGLIKCIVTQNFDGESLESVMIS